MKKIITTAFATMLVVSGYSQATNTFPDSGNVGIGTTTPFSAGGAAKWLTLEGSAYSGGIVYSANGIPKGYSYYNSATDGLLYQAVTGVPITFMPNNVAALTLNALGNATFAGSLTGTSATFSGALKFPAFDRGLEENTNGGISIFSNELNSGSGGVNGDLYLGYRRTDAIRIVPPTYFSSGLIGTSATFSSDITTPGRLILTNGAYDGTLIFGNNPTWKSGISTRDATNAEMRIWTNSQNAIYFANGFDGSQSGATLPTDGMKFANNSLGIGGFTVNEPIGYKLHVKGNSKFTDAVLGTSATFINSINVGSTSGNGIFINQASGTIIGNYSTSPWPGQNNLYVQGSSQFIGNLTGTSATFSNNIHSTIVPNDIVNIGTISGYPGYHFANSNGYWGIRSGSGQSFNIDTYNNSNPINVFKIAQNGNATFSGNVGIGANNIDPDAKLTVGGKIHSREVKVTINAGADFVFHKDYNLKPLAEVAEYISTNKHLPEIASADEMKKGGLDLGEMNIKLLQKIEELTLHLIQQNKLNTEQNKLIKQQGVRIESLEKQLKK